jgi:hypothetical protein
MSPSTGRTAAWQRMRQWQVWAVRVIRQQGLIVTDAAPCTFLHEGRRADLRCGLRRGLLCELDLSYTGANISLAKILGKANFHPVISLIVPSVSTALWIDLGGRAAHQP